MKVEGAVLGSQSLTVPMVSVNVKQHITELEHCINSDSALKSCVKVEVAVLGSLSLTVPMVSVNVSQH